MIRDEETLNILLDSISRFVREDGRWYYVDGEFPA